MRTLKLSTEAALPEGFRYQPDFLTEAEHQELLEQIRALSFEAIHHKSPVFNVTAELSDAPIITPRTANVHRL
jgi:hypothetical protein